MGRLLSGHLIRKLPIVMTIVTKNISLKGGKGKFPFRVETVVIQQPFNDHHTFEMQAIIPSGKKITMEDLRMILGEYVEISFASVTQSDRKQVFTGIIDSVTPYREAGLQRLKINGYSPTVLMDSGPCFRTFCGRTSHDIVDKVMSLYGKGSFPGVEMSGSSKQINFTV